VAMGFVVISELMGVMGASFIDEEIEDGC